MAGHRFEIGEGVFHVEKRFPTGTRRAELTVVERMLGAEGPEYRLYDADGLATCVLAEDQLSPRAPADTDGSRRIFFANRISGSALRLRAAMVTALQLVLAQHAVLVGVQRVEALGQLRVPGLNFVQRQLAIVVGIGFLEAGFHALLHLTAGVLAIRTGLLHFIPRDVAILVGIQFVEPFRALAAGGGSSFGA